MRIQKHMMVLFLIFLIFISGCGYTTRSLLAPAYRSIYVENFINKINITEEQTEERMYRGYRPGLEIDLTKAIIDRYILDGNLRIANLKDASLILRGELLDFRKEALLYDANNNVEEYRIRLVVNIELIDAKSDNTVWREKGFSGETTYRTGGSLAKSESTAIKEANADLARRIVERTIEGW